MTSDLEVQSAAENIDVLVIEDEEAMRNLLGDVLTQHGLEVRTAENGRRALQLLNQYRFTVVVTDVHMPEMDGLEIINHCAAKLPEVQILAISGGCWCNQARAALAAARLLGSERTLTKPFRLTDFVDAVAEMVARAP